MRELFVAAGYLQAKRTIDLASVRSVATSPVVIMTEAERKKAENAYKQAIAGAMNYGCHERTLMFSRYIQKIDQDNGFPFSYRRFVACRAEGEDGFAFYRETGGFSAIFANHRFSRERVEAAIEAVRSVAEAVAALDRLEEARDMDGVDAFPVDITVLQLLKGHGAKDPRACFADMYVTQEVKKFCAEEAAEPQDMPFLLPAPALTST